MKCSIALQVSVLCSWLLLASCFYRIPVPIKHAHQTAGRRTEHNLKLHAKPKHKVCIKHEGVNNFLEVNESESILDAALDAGIRLPHDCKMGVCLRCSAKVTSGQVDQTGTTLDDSVIEQGFALTCMTFARSELSIESVEEDELVNAQFSGRY